MGAWSGVDVGRVAAVRARRHYVTDPLIDVERLFMNRLFGDDADYGNELIGHMPIARRVRRGAIITASPRAANQDYGAVARHHRNERAKNNATRSSQRARLSTQVFRRGTALECCVCGLSEHETSLPLAAHVGHARTRHTRLWSVGWQRLESVRRIRTRLHHQEGQAHDITRRA